VKFLTEKAGAAEVFSEYEILCRQREYEEIKEANDWLVG